MKKVHWIRWALIGMIPVFCTEAVVAWGPRAQLSIISTAAQLVSREQSLPLTRLENDLKAGASLNVIALEALYPDILSNPLHAIENEMALLTAVKGARIDAYFVYRLGTLGKLVSRATAPMSEADITLGSQYYKDADAAIGAISLSPASRKLVESMAQLERTAREANAGNSLIESEYRDGVGFKGAGAAKLATDASRSVNAVADIWWTIISARVTPGNVSEEQLQRYVLSAFDYYISRGNLAEIESAIENYSKLVAFTPDLHARFGDMLYAANFKEKAIKEYEAVLAVTSERRDVVEKIADYYMECADTALEKNKLEDARTGFVKALEVNPLHSTAEQRRLEVESLIAQRDQQQAAYQATLKQAEDLRQLAEEEAARTRYAEAISLLQQSEVAFTSVGDEFPLEAQQRSRGLRDVQTRLKELKQSLLGNALAFSGSGFGPDTEKLIQESAKDLEKEALIALLKTQYQDEMQQLMTKMQPLLTIE